MGPRNLTIAILLLSSLAIFATNLARADYYLAGTGNYSIFNSTETDRYKIGSAGKGFGVHFGTRGGALGLEGFYKQLRTEGKMIHDSTDYTLHTDTRTYGAAFTAYISSFHIKLGYATHMFDQSVVDTSGATVQSPTITRIYGLHSGITTSGLMFGAGADLEYATLGFFIDYNRYQMTSIDASFQVIEAGIRWYPGFLNPTLDPTRAAASTGPRR